MSKKKTVILAVVSLILIIGIAILTWYLLRVKDYKQAIENIEISDIDLSSIEDGMYIGECNVDLIYAKVQVTVQDGKIAEIDLVKHENGRGELAEKIIDDIVKKQSINVDSVSGATNSSKVIKKAVENALNS